MRNVHIFFLARLALAAVLILVAVPASSTAMAQDSGNSFTNEEFGVTVEWGERWVADLEPIPGDSYLAIERDQTAFLQVIMIDAQGMTPEEAIMAAMFGDYEVLEDRMDESPPSITVRMPASPLDYLYYAHSVNDGDTIVVLALGAAPVLMDTAIQITRQDVTINGEPALADYVSSGFETRGDVTGDATPDTDTRTSRTTRGTTETPEATAEVTEESGRVSRTSRGTSETPVATETETVVATEEPTTEITRTSRTGSGESETPEATTAPTEDPTAEPTEEPTEEVIETDDPGTFTGPVWGYSVTYDTEMWEQSNTFDTPTVDGVRLDGDSATVSMMGLSEYGADPVGCLMGENEYYSSESDNISNWEVATDANGDQLWYESDELAWGVFSYTFHSSSGTDVEFVDYISCETIPGEDAVLVVQMTSFPDDYNDNLDAVLDILDTLEFQP